MKNKYKPPYFISPVFLSVVFMLPPTELINSINNGYNGKQILLHLHKFHTFPTVNLKILMNLTQTLCVGE